MPRPTKFSGQLEQTAFALVSRTASVVGDAYFPALAEALADALGFDAAFVAERPPRDARAIVPLALICGDGPVSVESFPLSGSAAEGAVGGAASMRTTGGRQAFPDDPLLAAAKAEGFLIVALTASDGTTNGFLGVMDGEGLHEALTVEAVLRLVGARAGAEIERLHLTSAIREQSALLQSFTDRAEDIIIRTRFERPPVIEYVNPAFERMTGYTAEELYADSRLLLRAIHPDFRDEFQELMLKPDPGHPMVWRWVRRDGSTLWTEARRLFLYDEQGAVVASESVVRDITAQRLAEERALEAERQQRMMLQAIPDTVFRLDRSGRITTIVDRPLDGAPFGRPIRDGADLSDVVPAEAAAALVRLLGAALVTGAHETHRFAVEEPEGDRTIEVRIAPIDAGSAMVFARDVTGEAWIAEKAEFERRKEEVEGKAERSILRHNPYGLTFREFTVLELMAEGLMDKQIAARLGISLNTVGKHVSNVLGKMKVSSRTEASIRAIQEHLLG